MDWGGPLVTSYTTNNATVTGYSHWLVSRNGDLDYNGDNYSTYNYAIYSLSFTVNGKAFQRANWGPASGLNKVTVYEWIYAPDNVKKTESASWVEDTPIYKLYFEPENSQSLAELKT